MFIATAGTPPGAVGVMIDLMTIGVKANTILNCGLPGEQITVRKLGWMKFYNCEQKTLSSMVDGLVRAAIEGEDQYGMPLDPSKSSLELISRDKLGDAYIGTFDNTGNLTLTIPIGDYKTNVKSPSFISQILDTSLSQEGVTLNLTMHPVPPPQCDWMACSNACYASYEACAALCEGAGDLIQQNLCVNACTAQWLACPSNTDPKTCQCIQ